MTARLRAFDISPPCFHLISLLAYFIAGVLDKRSDSNEYDVESGSVFVRDRRTHAVNLKTIRNLRALGSHCSESENRMLNLERHTKILELIGERGKVEVGELSRLFQISEVTIRTDLKELHKRGLVRRAHGGAVRIETVSVDASLQVKAALRADEKQRIGAAAAALIKDGDSVILDSGTTTQHIAKQIKDRKDLTVITNGINVAMELLGAKDVRLIILGGMVRQNSYSAVGHFAEDMLRQLSADKLFLAVDAFDLDFGLSTPNPEESKVNQAMVQIATEKILVADSSKFGKRSLSRIVPLSAIDKVITDNSLTTDIQAELRARGVEVLLV